MFQTQVDGARGPAYIDKPELATAETDWGQGHISTSAQVQLAAPVTAWGTPGAEIPSHSEKQKEYVQHVDSSAEQPFSSDDS